MQNLTPNDEAVFLFVRDIDQQSARDFAINLNEWSRANARKPLRIDLNSTGGNIGDALFLYEEFSRLRSAGHYLTIAAAGRAASCAAWLMQAADKRVIGAQSWLLIHEVSSRAEGTLSVMMREIRRMRELQEQSIRILVSRSKLTRKLILRQTREGANWWVPAKSVNGNLDALSLGLVDVVEEAPPFQTVTQ